MPKSMYVTFRQDGRICELRQIRYEGMVPEHPHDVCAVATSIEQMRGMVDIPGCFEGDVVWPEDTDEAIQ